MPSQVQNVRQKVLQPQDTQLDNPHGRLALSLEHKLKTLPILAQPLYQRLTASSKTTVPKGLQARARDVSASEVLVGRASPQLHACNVGAYSKYFFSFDDACLSHRSPAISAEI